MTALPEGDTDDHGRTSLCCNLLRSLLSIAYVLPLGVTAPVAADEPWAIYVSVSESRAQIGYEPARSLWSYVEIDDEFELEIDDEDSVHKFTVGLRPSNHLGLEVSYMDLGAYDQYQFIEFQGRPLRCCDTMRADLESMSASLLGFIPMAKFPSIDLFARGGVEYWRSDLLYHHGGGCLPTVPCPPELFLERTEESSVDLLLGAGIQVRYRMFGLRAEYEYLSAGDSTELFSIGAIWYFR